MRDPYDVLGVSKSASAAEIKSAFRRQAGLPAESALDLGGTRAFRHPQDVIGVTHPQSLSGRSPLVMPGIAPTSCSIMWGALPSTATREASGMARARGRDRLRHPTMPGFRRALSLLAAMVEARFCV